MRVLPNFIVKTLTILTVKQGSLIFKKGHLCTKTLLYGVYFARRVNFTQRHCSSIDQF